MLQITLQGQQPIVTLALCSGVASSGSPQVQQTLRSNTAESMPQTFLTQIFLQCRSSWSPCKLPTESQKYNKLFLNV